MFRFRFLTYTNFALVEKWYEDMAKDGWQIEKISLSFIHKFKKVDPENVKYKISIAPNEGTFTALTKDERKDFDNMADEYGWHLIDRSFNMNIYRLDKDGADSLYNDSLDEIGILNKAIRGEIISISFSAFIFAILSFFILGSFNSSEIYYSNYPLFMAPASIFLLVFITLSLFDFISFRKRNKDTKDIRDFKFSKLSFSKIFVFLAIMPLILTAMAWISSILVPIGSSDGLSRFLLILPNIFLLFLVYFLVKKIKLMDVKKKSKKLILGLMIVSLTLAASALTFFVMYNIDNKVEKEDHIGNFSVTSERKSLLTESCKHYSAKNYNLAVRKTLVKSENLAEDLFERIVKNSRNHPYRAGFVKDISKSYPYEKTYILSNENEYLILYNNVVLEINGDLNDATVQKDIEKILGEK